MSQQQGYQEPGAPPDAARDTAATAPPPGYSEPDQVVPHGTPYGGIGVVSSLPFALDASNDDDDFKVEYAFHRPIDGMDTGVSINYGRPFADAISRLADDLDASRATVLRALYDRAHPAHRPLHDFLSDAQIGDSHVLGGPGLADILRPVVRLRRLGERDKLILSNKIRGLTIEVGGVVTSPIGTAGHKVETTTGYAVADIAPILVATRIVERHESPKNAHGERFSPAEKTLTVSVSQPADLTPTAGQPEKDSHAEEKQNEQHNHSREAGQQADREGQQAGREGQQADREGQQTGGLPAARVPKRR